MQNSDSTCWTIIKSAANGNSRDREEFARRYGPVLSAYFAYRWRSNPLITDVDDAVQQIFVECFKHDGVLVRAESERGFRPFLYGVARNIALQMEANRMRLRETQAASDARLDQLPDSEEHLSRIFDRAWARELLRETARLHEELARRAGTDACRRIELLQLRFHEGLEIREIAIRWQVDPAELHHEYSRARQEFKSALMQVMSYYSPGSRADVERECSALLELLK